MRPGSADSERSSEGLTPSAPDARWSRRSPARASRRSSPSPALSTGGHERVRNTCGGDGSTAHSQRPSARHGTWRHRAAGSRGGLTSPCVRSRFRDGSGNATPFSGTALSCDPNSQTRIPAPLVSSRGSLDELRDLPGTHASRRAPHALGSLRFLFPEDSPTWASPCPVGSAPLSSPYVGQETEAQGR